MKYIFSSLIAIAMIVTVVPVSAETLPLAGKIIALDAGHGNGDTGAIGYCDGVAVAEADVNLAVRALVKGAIEVDGGSVHEVAQLGSRSDRVADAEAASAQVLISIHHNGSSNVSADYTQSFVTQKNDKVFAGYLHPKLVAALGLDDKGIKSDGYGMTVYGSLPGVLTESYFITNTDAACDFINFQNGAADTRVHKEAAALHEGLVAYFSKTTSGGGKGGRNK